MIDTIGIGFSPVYIPQNIYSMWIDEKHHRNKNYTVIWYGFTKYLLNGSSIRYTYYPYLKSGLLKIEFSLPNILYGNNVQMIYDIEKAIDTANLIMPDIPGIPQVDLWAGILYRLDICYNFQVSDLVSWYIKALLPLEYPYRRTRPYTSQGVQYENKQVILRIYDKARERKDLEDDKGALAACGIMRAELELKRAYIKKLTQCKKPTLCLISLNWTYDVIEKELKKLNLIGNSIGTVDSTLKVLREKNGSWEALALVGLLHSKVTYPSTELLAQDVGLHPNSIGRHIHKKLAENGIPPTLTEHIEPLPPLWIDRCSVKTGRRPPKMRRLGK
jgi:hypothetical protein